MTPRLATSRSSIIDSHFRKTPRALNRCLPSGSIALTVEQLEDRFQPSGVPTLGSLSSVITSNTFLVSEDNSVVLENSLTGDVIATYPTGVANDGSTPKLTVISTKVFLAKF